jgi:sterol desaturase/sphingolipid hydroxylase (fatty acid hydroxylase superfamily)
MDNRLHRIHHSREERHINHNFATRTPVWDMLCGIAHFPRHEEWPAVGLANPEEPKTLLDYLLLAFRAPVPRPAEALTPA